MTAKAPAAKHYSSGLKPIYIITFFSINLALFIFHSVQFITRLPIPNLGNASVIVLSASILIYFLKNRSSRVAHKKRFNNSVLTAFLISLGITVVAIFSSKSDLSHPMLTTLALFMMWTIYEIWYCNFNKQNSNNPHIALGKYFMPSQLKNTDESQFNLPIEHGKYHIYIFHNANWNNFCLSHIKEMNKDTRILNNEDFQIYLIGNLNKAETHKLQRLIKFRATVLLDKDHKFSDSLGIEKHNSYPLCIKLLGYKQRPVTPAVIVTNPDDQIVYNFVANNTRFRPTISNLITKIKAAQL